MGMTIDDAVRSIAEIDKAYRSFSDNEYQALNVAVETMRKYQNIEQIVSDFRKYQKGITWGFGGEKYMQMVSEVVEDGSN